MTTHNIPQQGLIKNSLYMTKNDRVFLSIFLCLILFLYSVGYYLLFSNSFHFGSHARLLAVAIGIYIASIGLAFLITALATFVLNIFRQNKRLISPTAIVILTLFSICALSTTKFLREQERLKQSIEKEITNFRKNLPLKLSDELTLQNSRFANNTLYYDISLINYKTDAKGQNNDFTSVRADFHFLYEICSNKKTRAFLEKNITLDFSFYDNDDKSIGSFDNDHIFYGKYLRSILIEKPNCEKFSDN